MRLTVLLALVLAASAHASDDESVLQGVVKGQTLMSPELRGVSLDFAKSLTYAGCQRFNLYGVAIAEQHFFVEAGQEGTIRRFYWVQFEHYLATNQMPDAIVRARCFYLPDSSNRSELMIIYGEVLTQADLDGAAIPAEESADVKYPQLAAKVIEHVNRGVNIHRR